MFPKAEKPVPGSRSSFPARALFFYVRAEKEPFYPFSASLSARSFSGVTYTVL